MEKLITLSELQKLKIENLYLKRENYNRSVKDLNDLLDKECREVIKAEHPDANGTYEIDLTNGIIKVNVKDETSESAQDKT